MSHKTPPHLPKHWLWGNLREFNADSLGFIEKAAACDDVMSIYFGPLRGYFVNHPDYVREILSSKAKLFQKPSIVKRALVDITGNNIFTSNGDFWKQQHKLMQPIFHAKRIDTYAETMLEYTLYELENWKNHEQINLDEAITRITMNVIIKTMFGGEVGSQVEELREVFSRLFQLVYQRMMRFAIIPSWLPTSENREILRLTAILRAIVQQFIDERRKHGDNNGDLLFVLLAAQKQSDYRLSDEQVMREALTILGAGFETTAYTIIFAWYALAQNPIVAEKLYDEVDSVLGECSVALDDLPQLTYTETVIKETQRLYPTAWGFSRSTLEDVVFGDYRIPKNSTILISPWTLGRDRRWFDAPHEFRPERFNPENEANIPRYAYIPFGGGARICIGNQFALMEARIVIATIAQHYRLSLETGFSMIPKNAAFTLRPDKSINMTIQSRETEKQQT